MIEILNPRHYRIDPDVRAHMPTIQHITRCNVDALLNAHALQIAMRNGKWWQIRRNGITITWKRAGNAHRIRIPYKFGLYGYGAITEADFIPYNDTPPSTMQADAKCVCCPWESETAQGTYPLGLVQRILL